MFMKSVYHALVPLLIVLFCALVSALLSTLFLILAGDIIELRKLVSKGAQLLLLLSIFPLRRYLKLSWAQIGFAPKAIFAKQIRQGLGLGLATLMPVMLVLYGLEISVFDADKSWTLGTIIARVLLALLLAMLIAMGEEPLFSGILLARLRKKMLLGLAITISAGYYSAFHFIKTKTTIPYHELSLGSGFQLVAEAFANLLNPAITPALIALFVIGLFLLTIRTQIKNSIGICIGCHTAWVWQIKLAKDFFDTNKQSTYYYLVSDYDGIVGPLVTVWLLLCLAAYFIWKKLT